MKKQKGGLTILIVGMVVAILVLLAYISNNGESTYKSEEQIKRERERGQCH